MDGADPRSGAASAENGSPLDASRRWPLRDLILLAVVPLLAAFAISVALVIGLGIARGSAQARGPDEILVLTVLSDGALLVALFLIASRAGLRPSDLGFRRLTRAGLTQAVILAGGLWAASLVVSIAAVRVFGPHPQSLVVTFGAHSGAVAYVLDLASSAVVAPVAEETLFRGVIFGGLAQRMSPWAAAAGSALLFAGFHGLGVILPVFVLGLGLAYIYIRTGTIWASMTAHGLVNAVSVTALFLSSGR